jgi:hypothetical protein
VCVSIQVISHVKGKLFMFHTISRSSVRVCFVSIQVISHVKGKVKFIKLIDIVTITGFHSSDFPC